MRCQDTLGLIASKLACFLPLGPNQPWRLSLALRRVRCRLTGWQLKWPSSIRMVGTEALVGESYVHTSQEGSSKELPVLPSDHFGLLLHLAPVGG